MGIVDEECLLRYKRMLDRLGSGFIKRELDFKIDDFVFKLWYYLVKVILEWDDDSLLIEVDKRCLDCLDMGFIKKCWFDCFFMGFIKCDDDEEYENENEDGED